MGLASQLIAQFTVLVVWIIALAAVLYGVDALAKTTQTTRHVGDGSIYTGERVSV
jgi:hypothetical protein